MKKVLVLGVAVCAIFTLAGCGKDEKKLTKNEETMKQYATEFYNAHQKGDSGLTNPSVTIEQLKSGNEFGGDNFDLSKLEKCKDTSKVELKIDETTREITDYVFSMECE